MCRPNTFSRLGQKIDEDLPRLAEAAAVQRVPADAGKHSGFLDSLNSVAPTGHHYGAVALLCRVRDSDLAAYTPSSFREDPIENVVVKAANSPYDFEHRNFQRRFR